MAQGAKGLRPEPWGYLKMAISSFKLNHLKEIGWLLVAGNLVIDIDRLSSVTNRGSARIRLFGVPFDPT